MRSRPPELIGPLALVVLAGLVVHASALSRPFFADDYLFLDLVMRRPGLAAFGAPDAIGNFFRPLARAGWFALLGPLTGQSSVAFHAANLLLFALVLVLLAFVAWRLLGGRAAGVAGGTGTGPGAGAAQKGAIVAVALVAVHEAFDVPVGWVSGSQDLLALAFALASLWLVLERRAWWGAVVLVLGLLCKESIAPAPLVAFALAWAMERSWRPAARRALPLALATAAWAAVWWALRARGVGAHTPLAASATDVLAALFHGLQTVPGLEYANDHPPRFGAASCAAAGLAALAVWLAARRPGMAAKTGRKPATRGATPKAASPRRGEPR